jgi:O-antigen/teichoic acid export membrane protein
MRLVSRARIVVRRARDDSLHRNSLYIMAVTVVTAGLGFVYWLFAAHTFSASQVGFGATLVSTMTLISMLANLGINTALVQRLPGRSSGKDWSATLNAGLLLGGASSLLGGVLGLYALPLISSQFDPLVHTPLLAVTFVAGVVLTTATNLLDYACIAERAAGQTLARNAVFAVVKIPLLVLPPVADLGVRGIMVSWVGTTAATVVMMVMLLPRLGQEYRLSGAGLLPELRQLWGYLAGHHSINIGSFAPWWLLPVLVTSQISPVATAYFYATWRVSGLLYMIAPSFASSLAAEGAHNPGEVRRIAISSARATVALLVPGALVVAAAGWWILAAFGRDYAEHGYILLILFVGAALPDAVMSVYVSVLRVEERLRLGGFLQLGTAILSLTFAWAFLPSLGIAAAGIGWVLSRLVGCAVIWVDQRYGGGRVIPVDAKPSWLHT